MKLNSPGHNSNTMCSRKLNAESKSLSGAFIAFNNYKQEEGTSHYNPTGLIRKPDTDKRLKTFSKVSRKVYAIMAGYALIYPYYLEVKAHIMGLIL